MGDPPNKSYNHKKSHLWFDEGGHCFKGECVTIADRLDLINASSRTKAEIDDGVKKKHGT